ncbi:type II toxin-antitoxin system VapC family toxin [Terrimonas alba]|uniref:type II toxin-antitoxin system VapC family toxin n=1 Tax=Terrimonas alba TaxID=3349636 RepID=UPI0035F4D6DE
MAKFVLDSYALLAFFRDEPGADDVEKLLNEAAEDKHELYITVVNAGEVYYMSCRKDSVSKANQVWEAMKKFPLHFIAADMDLSLAAAKIKANYKLSYADAFAAALTIQKKATLVTGDDEYQNLVGETGFKVKYI